MKNSKREIKYFNNCHKRGLYEINDDIGFGTFPISVTRNIKPEMVEESVPGRRDR